MKWKETVIQEQPLLFMVKSVEQQGTACLNSKLYKNRSTTLRTPKDQHQVNRLRILLLAFGDFIPFGNKQPLAWAVQHACTMISAKVFGFCRICCRGGWQSSRQQSDAIFLRTVTAYRVMSSQIQGEEIDDSRRRSSLFRLFRLCACDFAKFDLCTVETEQEC